jgi:hypothetical protein
VSPYFTEVEKSVVSSFEDLNSTLIIILSLSSQNFTSELYFRTLLQNSPGQTCEERQKELTLRQQKKRRRI